MISNPFGWRKNVTERRQRLFQKFQKTWQGEGAERLGAKETLID